MKTAGVHSGCAIDVNDGCPYIRVKGLGAYTKVDLGIVAYHFEVASGKKVQH